MSKRTETKGAWMLVGGWVTIVMALCTFLALDDITTGNESDLSSEYGILIVAAIWYLILAAWLVRSGHVILGIPSGIMLAGALWALGDLGPGANPDWKPEYVVIVVAWVWFLALSPVLLVRGRRVAGTGPG